MTSIAIRTLDQAIDNREAYFRVNNEKTLDYLRNVIAPALNDAVNEATKRLLHRHQVDITRIVNVVHYTSLQALFSMIYDGPEPSEASKSAQTGYRKTDYRFLRLYDSANLNDPSEGSYFLKRFTKAYNVVREPAFIASFVTPHRPENSETIRDNLVFWRHYGKDGRGCSISIPADRFAPTRSDLILQAVTYGTKCADKDAQELRSVVERLDPVLKDATGNSELEKQIAATILESLGKIPYLYKSSAYEYEGECRIIARGRDFRNHGGILYAFEGQPHNSGRLRMYGQHPCLNLSNILSTGSVITLGPAVPNADNIQYALEQLLDSIGISRFPIKQSEIPYR